MKLPRISKPILQVLIGPLLLMVLAYAIWRTLDASEQWPLLKENFHLVFTGANLFPFFLLILLMPLNWLLEAFKWKVALQGIQPISIWTAFRATLSGVSFSVLLPNRVGEYLGRVLYLPTDKRATAVAVTMVASMSQLIWTIFYHLFVSVIGNKTFIALFIFYFIRRHLIYFITCSFIIVFSNLHCIEPTRHYI